jgi:hypothetical protein
MSPDETTLWLMTACWCHRMIAAMDGHVQAYCQFLVSVMNVFGDRVIVEWLINLEQDDAPLLHCVLVEIRTTAWSRSSLAEPLAPSHREDSRKARLLFLIWSIFQIILVTHAVEHMQILRSVDVLLPQAFLHHATVAYMDLSWNFADVQPLLKNIILRVLLPILAKRQELTERLRMAMSLLRHAPDVCCLPAAVQEY